MKTGGSNAYIRVLDHDDLGTGAFDGGRITEIKPIGFPGDGSTIKRVGPLFYWAWARSESYGKIGLHPHKAFEIISYVLEGDLGHYDTLGNKQVVGKGGAQIMQTGSGVSHEEETIGENMEFFQIWFEPDIRESVKKKPAYYGYEDGDFPVENGGGYSVKKVIGKDAPVQIETDGKMDDVDIKPNETYAINLPEGRSLAVVVISGGGKLSESGADEFDVERESFVVVEAKNDSKIELKAGSEGLRTAIVEVPTSVDYELYPKG